MCGIVGILSSRAQFTSQELGAIATGMRDALSHRGPDSAGTWTDPDASIAALAQRRLAIIDLSPSGAQPMVSHSGRYVLTFNGEIYNYRDLRYELEGVLGTVGWRGTSDTEVFLEAIAVFGLEEAVRKTAGMFAFGLWDRAERTLSLGRDRLGEKPLYYGWIGGDFVFASELKAFARHPNWSPSLDRDALLRFVRFGYVPSPSCIYSGIRKLAPGHLLSMSASARPRELPVSRPYWSLEQTVTRGLANQITDEGEAEDALAEVISRSIKGQMISDVPLGAFLSGGVDSSTIVALMQSISTRPVKTFTIGFREGGFDEAGYARRVAHHLGTEHHEHYISAQDALAVIPRLPVIYDEPFADSSQIPTFLISEFARKHVTVSLSGDGGDELFGGYSRYLWARKAWAAVGWMPHAPRTWMARALRILGPGSSRALEATFNLFVRRSQRIATLGDRTQKAAAVLDAAGPEELHLQLASLWPQPELAFRLPPENHGLERLPWNRELTDDVAQMMYADTATYLTDDVLTKVDRAAMAVGLETRVPLLDHRVVELAWSLPMKMRIRAGSTKWILRRLLDRHVPSELVERSKMGFSVPIASWLRGPLRGWADDLLSHQSLSEHGLLDSAYLQKLWTMHASGRGNFASQLWPILMFQAWFQANRVRPTVQ